MPWKTSLRAFYATHNPVLLSVGLLEPEYNLPLQIAALGKIREMHPGAGLVMIGSGSLKTTLRAQIAALPWAEHMLLPGDVPHAATLPAIEKCSVMLRTTLYDGDSISVREALSIGTPVIATDNGMRPSGCHLIPMPPSQDAVVEAASELLTAGHRVAPDTRRSNTTNLKAVLDLYLSL